ncbi:MAG: transposase, partial [Candidatus Eiseniibacteriota bacterium]
MRSRRPTIPIEEHHRLVLLTDALDWTGLEEVVDRIRLRKVKNEAGRPPHLRATIGAVVLMSTQKVTVRHAEDLIRHYAPARYLCGLTETDWSPDFTTIHDFTQLMGEDGIGEINAAVVMVAVADTTVQEAAIPYPNEVGLMAAYVTAVGAASQRAGNARKEFAKKTAGQVKRAKEKIRGYRLFATTKEAKDTVTAEMVRLIGGIQVELGKALHVAEAGEERVTKS